MNLDTTYPTIPPIPGPVHVATTFGADFTGAAETGAAMQRAFDAIGPSESLVFPPGKYLHNTSLRLRRPGMRVFFDHATLHSTNSDDGALTIEADNVEVYYYRRTCVATTRGNAPRHSAILVAKELPGNRFARIVGTRIQGCDIGPEASAPVGQRNGSAAGGIMLMHADGFLLADNKVRRTLADGIHMTKGCSNGRVLYNSVQENGDDMIAIVSYCGKLDWSAASLDSAAALLAEWDVRAEQSLCHSILVAGNVASGNYWGRGLSVIGGEDIALYRNNVSRVPQAAGILIAREAGFYTFGVNGVDVLENTVTDVQQGLPLGYDPDGTFAGRAKTGHGGIEVHASLFADEAASADLRQRLSVRNVRFSNPPMQRVPNGNLIRGGVRIGGAEGARQVVTGDVGYSIAGVDA